VLPTSHSPPPLHKEGGREGRGKGGLARSHSIGPPIAQVLKEGGREGGRERGREGGRHGSFTPRVYTTRVRFFPPSHSFPPSLPPFLFPQFIQELPLLSHLVRPEALVHLAGGDRYEGGREGGREGTWEDDVEAALPSLPSSMALDGCVVFLAGKDRIATVRRREREGGKEGGREE